MDTFGMALFVIGGIAMLMGLSILVFIGFLFALIKVAEMSDNGRDSD
jgi:hypothetical protein